MHRFYMGTNLVRYFVIGYETEPDNFYIKGETLGDAPVISCRIHGPNGDFLFGLYSNKLTRDSLSIYRRLGFRRRPGWSIQDDTGKDVISIETVEGEEARQIVRNLAKRFRKEDETAQRMIEELSQKIDKVTRIYGELFDKYGKLAAHGDENRLLVNCPLTMA